MRILLLLIAVALIASLPFISNWMDSTRVEREALHMRKIDIEKVIDNYIDKYPEKILASLNKYRNKQLEAEDKAQLEEAKNLITQYKAQIIDFTYPSIKNKINQENTLTLVEFFDYSCGYCKRSKELIRNIISKYPNINYIFRSFPMLGEGSMLASKYELAVYLLQPQKYLDFQDKALSLTKNDYTEEKLANIIQAIGLNKDEFTTYLKANDVKISSMIQNTVSLASKIGIRGVPSFILGDKLIVGTPTETELEQYIKDKVANANELNEKEETPVAVAIPVQNPSQVLIIPNN